MSDATIFKGPWKRRALVQVTPYDEILANRALQWFERREDGALVIFPEWSNSSGFCAPVPMCDEPASYQDTLEKKKRGAVQPLAITMALNSRGMNGPEVDEALGVVEPTVDLWESGELTPTHEDVRRLVTLTTYPVGFFYHEHPKHEGVTFMCGEAGGLLVDGEFSPFDPCPACGGSGKGKDALARLDDTSIHEGR